MPEYVPPSQKDAAFNCPHCGAYTQQLWRELGYYLPGQSGMQSSGVHMAICAYCKHPSLWYQEYMLFPLASPAPLPNGDLPDDVKVDYLEARDIVARSPRGAAALLRLAIDKLCIHLGAKGDNLNTRIGDLVRRERIPELQKALDAVRIVGNEAVHPGELDLRDDQETAEALFFLVNEIAAETISKKNRINQIYNMLPESKLEQIEKRDSRANQ